MPTREGCRVFLGNLSFDVRERDIERFFERFGRVRNIFIKSGKYGFCEFDDYRDADDAVYELNGRDLLGSKVVVEHARGPRRNFGGSGAGPGRDRRRPWVDKYGPPTRTDYRVIVENLSSRVSWQDLKDLMRRAGEVSYANAHNDRRNEGVVEFSSRRDMERALDKYDGYELHGRKLKLIKDRDNRSRSRSRSRSSRRSRSRSRSPRSKSRSRSRDDKKSKSRSRSRSRSTEKRKNSRSRSKSRSGSGQRKKSKSRSRSRSGKSRSRSGTRSRSPVERKSRSRSRSKSPVKERAKSRSKSPEKVAVNEEIPSEESKDETNEEVVDKPADVEESQEDIADPQEEEENVELQG